MGRFIVAAIASTPAEAAAKDSRQDIQIAAILLVQSVLIYVTHDERQLGQVQGNAPIRFAGGKVAHPP